MPIPLRPDFDATRLRVAARESKDAGQTRRLLALAAIYEGATRTEAAKIGGVTLQIVRDWVVNRVSTGYDNLLDHCCDAWNKLVDHHVRWNVRLGASILIRESWYKPWIP